MESFPFLFIRIEGVPRVHLGPPHPKEKESARVPERRDPSRRARWTCSASKTWAPSDWAAGCRPSAAPCQPGGHPRGRARRPGGLDGHVAVFFVRFRVKRIGFVSLLWDLTESPFPSERILETIRFVPIDPTHRDERVDKPNREPAPHVVEDIVW